MTSKNLFFLIFMALLFLRSASAESVTIKVDMNAGKPISPDLVGIFFEDLNYAADGGLYAELVQNRSFEYQATEQSAWGPMTGWDFIQRGGGAGEYWVDSSCPVHPNNPHSILIQVKLAGEGVGLSNAGFDGIAVVAGEKYDFSAFARTLNVGVGRDNKPVGKLPLNVRLETKEGVVIGETNFETAEPAEWKQLTATITANQTVADARLVVLINAPGLIASDEISLFPEATFKGRKNGLRKDLAQAIADLHPKFVRFPGGCLVHGDGITNLYQWKDSIGPVEQRKGHSNIWRYHQSLGLGYFEYFPFCEDIGAKPLPVVAAGVSCQNSTRTRGTGQQSIPMADKQRSTLRSALAEAAWLTSLERNGDVVTPGNDSHAWINPLVSERADPHVSLQSDGYYYLTATVPEFDRSYEKISGNSLGNRDRATRAQVIRWNKDGSPDFGPPVPDGPYQF